MLTLPPTITKYAKSPDIDIHIGIFQIFTISDTLIFSFLEYFTISCSSSFHIKKDKHIFFHKIFILSFKGLIIESFIISYIFFSQSICAFFTYESIYIRSISLKINLQTDLNFFDYDHHHQHYQLLKQYYFHIHLNIIYNTNLQVRKLEF